MSTKINERTNYQLSHFQIKDKSSNNFSFQVIQHMGYQIYATIISFYLPTLIMIILNVKIWRAAKRLARQDRVMSGSAGPEVDRWIFHFYISSGLLHSTYLHLLLFPLTSLPVPSIFSESVCGMQKAIFPISDELNLSIGLWYEYFRNLFEIKRYHIDLRNDDLVISSVSSIKIANFCMNYRETYRRSYDASKYWWIFSMLSDETAAHIRYNSFLQQLGNLGPSSDAK